MEHKILRVKGLDCILDIDDYEYYSKWAWGLNSSGYARRTLKRAGYPNKTGLLHRLIMNAPKGIEIDHINGNKLDNRKSNLRFCTRSQNIANSKKRKGTISKYRGVMWNTRAQRWNVEVSGTWGGTFKDENLAGIKANELMSRLHGEFARLNIIK